MKNKFLRIFFLSASILVLGVIGLFAQIPWIETNYYLISTNQKIADGITLDTVENIIIKLEVPDYFPENDQCFDVWFSAMQGDNTLSVGNFSFKLFKRDNSEFKKENSYLFWDKGSREESFKIENYKLSKPNNSDKENYVFFRTAFDLDKISNFYVTIRADLILNGKPYSLDKKLLIEKKKQLVWRKFKVH
ncbi:MAG: hypothetical protein V4642_08095 [Bacteroidota bacterium]